MVGLQFMLPFAPPAQFAQLVIQREPDSHHIIPEEDTIVWPLILRKIFWQTLVHRLQEFLPRPDAGAFDFGARCRALRPLRRSMRSKLNRQHLCKWWYSGHANRSARPARQG